MPRRPVDDAAISERLAGLDRLLEHRVRLGACALLARNDRLSFSRLKELLGETDGSLGANLRRLEEAGYVTLRKSFRERRPVTWYRLSGRGRERLDRHLSSLAAMIETLEE